MVIKQKHDVFKFWFFPFNLPLKEITDQEKNGRVNYLKPESININIHEDIQGLLYQQF